MLIQAARTFQGVQESALLLTLICRWWLLSPPVRVLLVVTNFLSETQAQKFGRPGLKVWTYYVSYVTAQLTRIVKFLKAELRMVIFNLGSINSSGSHERACKKIRQLRTV